MRRHTSTVLLLATLGLAVSAVAQDEPSLVDLQGLDAERPTHAELEARYEAEQKAEQEARKEESRVKALINEQLRFQSDLMDESRIETRAADVLGEASPRIAPGPPTERDLPVAIFDS